MCALCGVLGVEHHWSATVQGTASADAPRRRAERARRIAVVNAVLAPSRLKLSEFRGTAYILRGPTGRSAVIDNLSELWPAAQAMTGRSLDPLDPAGLAALEAPRP